ncbi:hypothetical protein TrRE_jg8154 [Triparma retinervis]|uniref:Uncharacterized protein n=1 Tax=Triparma retinervis TaxID=2557542 RepID=A0A9W7FFN5_9STRA|nr:hypothetical protein TrRE_jg8154 [Triparma retinervis]
MPTQEVSSTSEPDVTSRHPVRNGLATPTPGAGTLIGSTGASQTTQQALEAPTTLMPSQEVSSTSEPDVTSRHPVRNGLATPTLMPSQEAFEPDGNPKREEIAYLKELLAIFKSKAEKEKVENEAKEAKIAKLEQELSAAFAKVKALTPMKGPRPSDFDTSTAPPEGKDTLDSLVHDKITQEIVENMASNVVGGLINKSTSKHIQKVEIGQILHGDKDQVLEYLLKESKSGSWKRWILEEHQDPR